MRIGIIGAGASGLTAAYFAAQSEHEVFLFEQKDKVGKKLLATGNGRCNITNINVQKMELSHYIGNNECYDRLASIFEEFGYEETISFFREIGIETKAKGELIYPYTEQAQQVVNALSMAVTEKKVKIITDCVVDRILPTSMGFSVKTSKGEYKLDRVIVSAGGKAQPKLGSDGSGYELIERLGHSITNVIPGLVQFKCQGSFFKQLSGVRVKAKAKLVDGDETIYEEAGEVQLTSYGLSGIVCMNLSNRLNMCKTNPRVVLDIVPEYERPILKELLLNRCENFKNRYTTELLIGLVANKLGDVLVQSAGISTHVKIGTLITDDIERLLDCLKAWEIDITGTNSFDEAQISLGGVALEEVSDTMESLIVPGLYITGEILNVHGDCGGYNLQLCWTTGAIAGMHAVCD